MIRVGPAGWSYADWEGSVYPAHKPRGFHPLRLLSRHLDCVEINSSFYGPPRAEHAAHWVELVEDRPRFRFLVKLSRELTHADLPDRDAERAVAREFLSGVEPLRRSGRLAAVLVQFPISFHERPSARERLRRVAESIDVAPLALEVRHRSWFEPAALEAIAGLGYSLVHIDLPASRDHPPEWHEATGAVGYLRLHGRNAEAWFDRHAGRDQRYDYLYGPSEVEQLASRARRIAQGAEDTYVITNNHFSGKAIVNALELRAALDGEPPTAHADWLRTWPRLERTCRGEGQGSLF